jgi:hypothetical protein
MAMMRIDCSGSHAVRGNTIFPRLRVGPGDAERRQQCVPTRSVGTRGTQGFSRFLLAAIIVGLVVGLASCRRGDHGPVYPVAGRVLFKGKPAEGAQVTLFPLDNGEPKRPHPGAQVQKSGDFRLSTYASYDGAPPGRYAVTIIYRSPERVVDDENRGPDLLLGRYADPKTTPLTVEIKEEENHLEPFDLR